MLKASLYSLSIILCAVHWSQSVCWSTLFLVSVRHYWRMLVLTENFQSSTNSPHFMFQTHFKVDSNTFCSSAYTVFSNGKKDWSVAFTLVCTAFMVCWIKAALADSCLLFGTAFLLNVPPNSSINCDTLHFEEPLRDIGCHSFAFLCGKNVYKGH